MKKLDKASAIALGADLSRADRSVDGVVKRLADAMAALAPKKGAPVAPDVLKAFRDDVRLGYFAERLFGGTSAAALKRATATLEKTGKEFSTEETATDQAFRTRWSRGLKTAGLVATHGNAGNKNAKPESAKPEAAKPESAKPEAAKPESAKPEAAKPAVKDYKPANAKDAAMFARQNIAALISVCKPVSSEAFLKALNHALAAAQVEIKNCE